MSNEREPEPQPRTYSAERVRQGEIVLRKPWQRIVFLAGLAGPFILLIVWLIVFRQS